jgi:Ca-activated chloride channel family protein
LFRFEHTEYLWAILVVIPVIIVFAIYLKRWRKNAIHNFGDPKIVERLMPNVSKTRPTLKVILLAFAFIFILLGLANLQFGTKEEEAKQEGVDLIIALDVSNSMMAEDLSPNRLKRATRAIEQLISNLHNDRLGIVVFAGNAYVQLPITTDYSAAKLFLNTIAPNMIATQGTAIGSAIELALESFNMEDASSKSIIVITDGENHEDNAIKAVEVATKKGITVHTIGMGSENGAPIPIYKQNRQIGFKQDKEGNTVITKLNEQMLQEIAAAGNGTYVRASNANAGLGIILDEIDKMEKLELGSKTFKSYEDRFQVFLLIGLLFLLLEFFLSNRKSTLLAKINLFGNDK